MSFPVHGAWARRSAAIDGGPPFETQLVYWLQAETCYADLRVPFHPAADQRCFTGRSFWDGDGYRWAHGLDLEAAGGVATLAADDLGYLAWQGDALVETGLWSTADGMVAYEEVWVRLPGDDGPWLALEAEHQDACLVRVGDHAITVVDRRRRGGSFAACYRVLEASGWRAVAVIGDGTATPGPDDTPSGWTVVHRGGPVEARP